MKKMLGALIIVFFTAASALAVDSGSVPASQQPVVKEKIGGDAISLEAEIYPKFMDLAPTAADPWCTPDNPKVFNYLTGKPITTKSNSPLLHDFAGHPDPRINYLLGTNPRSVVTTETWPNGRDLDKTKLGVQKTDLVMTLGADEINPRYRETAKVLVTWTMRIEGECPNWHIGHFICEPYNGSLSFLCEDEDVATWLHATYDVTDDKGNVTTKNFEKDLGSKVIMKIPATKTVSKQSDPTLIGTYVITRDDFPDNGNRIPGNLKLQVYWQHKGAMFVTSPKAMRSMIINVIPVSKTDK
jgi:hypothetical protein